MAKKKKIGLATDSNKPSKAANRAATRLSGKVGKEQLKMQKAITTLEKRIIADAGKLQMAADGTLLGPRVNLKQAQKLHTALTHQFEETFGKEIKKHVAGYNDVANWVLESFADLEIAADFTDLDRQMMKQLSNQSVLGFTQLSDAARTTVEQALYNGIATQAPMEDLVGAISAALTGKLDSRGRPLSANAVMYANDAVMNFYNSVHLQKGQDAGMEYYLYSGTIMANTRDFCSRRVGQVFHVDEINSWTHSWQGKSGPALTNRGGWNCRHHWQAVRPEWIPEEEDRKLEEAYIPPSRELKERATELGGLKFGQLDKLQKSQINKIGTKLKKGTMNPQTKYMETWGLLSEEAQLSKIAQWQSAGYDIPKWFSAAKPPPGIAAAEFQVIEEIEFKKPKVPKKAPIKPTDAEQIITGPIATTAAEAAVVEEVDKVGYAWKQLNAKQKGQIGKIGKKMDAGNFNPKSVYVDTWNELSIETQQMKIAQWKAKGINIHPNLPIKGVTQSIDNLTSATAKLTDEALDLDYTDPKLKAIYKDANLDYAPTMKPDTFLDVQRQFNNKYNIKTLGHTTYDEKTATQIFGKIDEEMDRVFGQFTEMDFLFNDLYARGLGTAIVEIELVEGSTVSYQAIASYSDTTKILKMPGKLSKKHSSLAKVGKATEDMFHSVVPDFYGTFRHEMGHAVDNALRKAFDKGLIDFNHQDEWRKIYKSFNQSEWKRMFGTYSSTDKYEGFAEAFKIYTSPRYKAGMLPRNMEKYLNKVLGGGQIAEEVVLVDIAAQPKIFLDPTHQKSYESYYNHYKARAMSVSELQTEIKIQCSNILEAAKSWQGSTQGYHPSALKLKAEFMEADQYIKWLTSSGSGMGKGESAKKVARLAADISDTEYIRLRALTQEYYDRTGQTSVRLYRGTDGPRTGPAFRSAANKAKSQYDIEDWDGKYVEFREPSVNGWSSSKSKAKTFAHDGVVVGTDIPTQDILLADDLWPKTGYLSEREYLVLRRTNQKYALSTIESGFEEAVIEMTAIEVNKATQAWKTTVPDVIEKSVDMMDATLHYIKATVPDFKTNPKKVLDIVNKKLDGIAKATKAGQDVKILGKTVIGEGNIEELIGYFEEMEVLFDDIYMQGHVPFTGWADALQNNHLEEMFDLFE